jgi:hypothetical protein
MMTRWLLAIAVLTSLVDLSQSIDLELSLVTCDESLPIYANKGDVAMTCNGATRCTFGSDAIIEGSCKLLYLPSMPPMTVYDQLYVQETNSPRPVFVVHSFSPTNRRYFS